MYLLDSSTTVPVDMIQPVNRLHPLNRGLFARWLVLPGTAGGSRLMDILNPGPNGHHGTLKNIDPVTDWLGSVRRGAWGALHFTRTGISYVGVGTLGSFGSGMIRPFTMAAWIHYTASQKQHIFGTRNSSSQTHLSLAVNSTSTDAESSGRINVSVKDESNVILQTGVDTDTGIRDGNWHHICAVVDAPNNDVAIYVDGVSQTVVFNVSDGPSNFGDFTSARFMMLGAFNNGTPGTGLQGELDGVDLWTRGLSAFEVRQYHNLTSMGYPGLLNRVKRRLSVAAAAAPVNPEILIGGGLHHQPLDEVVTY